MNLLKESHEVTEQVGDVQSPIRLSAPDSSVDCRPLAEGGLIATEPEVNQTLLLLLFIRCFVAERAVAKPKAGPCVRFDDFE